MRLVLEVRLDGLGVLSLPALCVLMGGGSPIEQCPKALAVNNPC